MKTNSTAMPSSARGTASGAMKMKSKVDRTIRGARTTPLSASAATNPSGSTMAAARNDVRRVFTIASATSGFVEHLANVVEP